MNIGGFLRRLSTSSDHESEEGPGGASILDSMAAKKNGLMSDISTTFHHIKRRASLGINELGGLGDDEEPEIPQAGPPPPPPPVQPASPPPMPPPPPPPPANTSTARQERRRSSASRPRPPRPPSPPRDRRPSQSSISDPPFRDRRNSLVNDPPSNEPYRRESISEDFGFEMGSEGQSVGPANGNTVERAAPEMSDITQYECQKIVSALGDLMSFDKEAGGGSSSASEYGGDHGDVPFYAEEAPVERRASLASVESLSDDMALSVRQFVSRFTEQTFHNNKDISQGDKATFGKYCQHHTARSWFAKQLQKMRQNQQCVDETTFYSLVQHFSVVLFECNEAEDYVPAMHLMHMSFTFYTEVKSSERSSQKMYLYNFLKEQAIWRSLRFWNAAFFEAVQEQRANNPICWNEDGQTAVENDAKYQENIMFGQLSAFSCNMRALGLNKEVCLEFLRKQSTIAGLNSDKFKMLRDNIEKWKE